MNYKLVEKVYNDGLTIASLIRNAANEKEADSLSGKVEDYCNFLDDNFGTIDEDAIVEEESCYLSFELYMAYDEKCTHIPYIKNSYYGNDGVDSFVEQLYSDIWLYEKIIYEYMQAKQNKEKIASFKKELKDFLKTTTHLHKYQRDNITELIDI